MIVLLLISTILAALVLAIWVSAKPFYWANRNVKYKLPWPLFGHNFGMIHQGSVRAYTNIHNNLYRNERIVGVHYFRQPALIIRDPAIVQEVTVKKFECFSSNNMGGGDPKKDMMEQNVLCSYGQRWKELRGKMSPLFTPARLKEMLKIVDTTMNKVEKRVEDTPTVLTSDLSKRITADMIVAALFSVESDAFKENSQFLHAGEMIFSPPLFKTIFVLTFKKLFKSLGLASHNKSAEDFLRCTLRDVLEFREKESVSKTDFLQGLLELKKNAETDEESEKGDYYDDGTVRVKFDSNTVLANSFILFAGGFETSAQTLTFLLYELSRHPEVQEKCREEILYVSRDSDQSTIDYSDMNKLKYVKKVVQEVLRLYPSFPITTRRCTKACKIDNDSFPIDEGVLIILPILNMQRDSKWFPDEPNEFKPERWDDEQPESGSYLPFGLGPRVCIGQGFAKAQVTLAIARILQKFKLRLNARTANPIEFSRHFLVTSPATPIWVDFHKISCSSSLSQ